MASYGANADVTLLTQVASTANVVSEDQDNMCYRGLHVILVTSAIGTGSITLTIQGKDPASGLYYTLLAGAAVTTNTTNVYKVYPGLPATANVSANDILPRRWRVSIVANNANPADFTVGVNLVV